MEYGHLPSLSGEEGVLQNYKLRNLEEKQKCTNNFDIDADLLLQKRGNERIKTQVFLYY